MKYARIFAVAIVAFALATPAGAKTTTWTGGGTDASFANKDNWSDGAPSPGDTVVISVTANSSNNPLIIGVADETFDIGSAGLTLNITTRYTKFYVNFTGSGKIVKTGNGRLGVACDSEFTGGTEVQDGNLATFKQRLGFGTGAIDFCAGSYNPALVVALYAASITNAVKFTGSVENYTVMDSGMAFTFSDDVTAEHDVQFNAKAGNVTFAKGFSAPGKTVTINANRTTSGNADIIINGTVDANVVKTGNKTLELNGSSPVATNTLTVSAGTCEIGASGFWGGTNIAVAAEATLTLNGSGNLAPSAHLAVAEGGTIEVAKDVTVQVAALTVGEEDLLPGIYTASTLPGTVSGSGTLLVLGDNPFVWTGADADNPAQWSVAANWQGNEVPGDGAVVYFPASTVVSNTASTVDVGASGLTLVLGGTVDFRDPLSGTGALTVTGTGRLNLDDATTHTGGTIISGSAIVALFSTDNEPLGTGNVTIDGSNGGIPGIRIAKWGVKLPNDFTIHGAITNKTSQSGYGCIDNPMELTVSGNMTGDDDILLYCSSGTETVSGDITVPAGKTIRLKNVHNGSTASRRFALSGALTGNLSIEGTWIVRLFSAATCTGDVTVAATATLGLNGAGNLAETATVSVADGGKIDIASGVKVKVAELWVGGVQQPDGVYSASKLPETITGSGKLAVGKCSGLTIFVL